MFVSLWYGLKNVKNMTTVIIEENTPEAKTFLEYTRTLPFVTIIEAKKKSFEEAAAECDAISIDAFFDELNSRIEKWDDHA